MRKTLLALATLCMLSLALAPAASAHERYFSDDDTVMIILGEQNEPVYTYDWTNLDLIVRDNATGASISGVEATLNVTLIAPNGEELSLPIEPQHGEEGRYEFVEDYFLTMPGQYKARLEGTINGTDVTGEYLLPGPRGAMDGQAFPHPVESDLRTLHETTADLQAQIDALEAQLAELEEAGSGEDGTTQASTNAPAPAALALVATLGALAVLARRR